jgi:DNA primase
VGRVLIAFDRDEAGDRGADALAKRLGAEGIECFRVLFPAGQDANSFATSVQEPAGALAQLLREAVWIGAGTPQPAPAVSVEPGGGGGARAQLERPEDTEREGALSSAAEAARPAPPPRSLPPSSPVPAPPGVQPVVKLEAEELRVEIEDRRWRIRGLGKASSFELLRVNVLVARAHPRRGEVFHVDSLDLYSARARGVFARAAGEELGVAEELVARDLGRVLLTCEEHAERAVREARAPREPEVKLSSRKLDRPLAVIVQSTSAAGKSALQEAVLSMVPEEERVSFSAMTGQSLFYMGESDLQHKVLAVAEEEGAERAAYALKLLQSEGELRIASTGKDGQTGRLVTHTYTVRGPVAIMLTTTTIDVDEELLNRCVVLSVDEEREQTRAIHERQRERETLGGLLAEHERQGSSARSARRHGLYRPP